MIGTLIIYITTLNLKDIVTILVIGDHNCILNKLASVFFCFLSSLNLN